MLLSQLKDGYRYNSDSIFLYDFIKKRGFKGVVLDVGCGCGIVGALLKKDKENIDLWAVDIQPININITNKNFSNNSILANTLKGDFLNMDFSKKFDLIVSNPPYYHLGTVSSENEHKAISRSSLNMPLDEFLLKCKKTLTNEGRVIFCYDAKQLPLVLSYATNLNFRVTAIRFVHPNLVSKATLLMVELRKNSKSMCEVLPPLIVHEEGKYSKEVQEIFDNAKTKSVEWE
ncbi:MAG: methyltransferase [Campylobacterales bacterium]|nr:methyltransferase [Campylobacterales bacterium]